MDGASTSTNSRTQAPQKRVLPARSRRGGPGVGSCDIDLMILDRQKRKLEYDPLIPAGTRLLLTTNPYAVTQSSSTLQLGMNIIANDRYFDRPDVVKAYREQEIIQTPEFINIKDNPAAMGRLRPRNPEDGTTDTSDVAYEKRHRKYESFEKRIRLREKEKLKHEQYKLKERIDQLRAMDGGAFLSLPASSFSPVPGQRDGNPEDSRSAGARINNAAAHNEGERRRKEMLEVASCLEERYRTLLPPDRFRKAPIPNNLNMPIEPNGVVYVGRDSRRYDAELDEEPLVEVTHKEPERPKQSENSKPKIKFNGKPGRPGRPKKRKQSLPPALEPTPSTPPVNNERPRSLEPASPTLEVTDHEPTPILSSPSPRSDAASRPTTPISNPAIAVLQLNSRDVTPVPHEEEEYVHVPSSATSSPVPVALSPPAVSRVSESPEPAPRPRKRVRLSSLPSSSSRNVTRETSVPPIESIPASTPTPRKHSRTQKQGLRHVSYAGAAGKTERTKSHLMVAAVRRSANSSRQVTRHISAFGMKIRNDIFEEAEFSLPFWVHGREEPPPITQKNVR